MVDIDTVREQLLCPMDSDGTAIRFEDREITGRDYVPGAQKRQASSH